MLTVGTSAGGRQPKAIIAINQKTGEIRSGQISGLKNYDYYH
jgi:serine/threonine-protein kinase HipA